MAKIIESLLSFRRPKQIDLEDYLHKLAERNLTKDGKLIPDPVPIAPPVGYKRQPTMVELMRATLHSEMLRRELAASGAETLEEADDFEVGDDPPSLESGYENDLDPPLTEILQAGAQSLKAKAKAKGEGAEGAGSQNKPAPTPPAPEPPEPE